MISDTLIFKCLKNLRADYHFCSLVHSRFYHGDPKGLHALVAEVRHIAAGEHKGKWEILEFGEDAMDPSVMGPYASREKALEAIAGEFWAWAREA